MRLENPITYGIRIQYIYIQSTFICYILYIVIQAKKFLKGDWLKQVIFQPNLKYIYMLVFNFHCNWHGHVLILKTWWKGFLDERECCVYLNSIIMFTFRREIVTITLQVLAAALFIVCQEKNGQWVNWRLHNHIETGGFVCERTCTHT